MHVSDSETPFVLATTLRPRRAKAERITEEDRIIQLAMQVLEQRAAHTKNREVFGSPDAVKHYLCLRYGCEQVEKFGVLFLDAQNRLIAADTLFHGTLTQTSVYPREVVRHALERKAAAVIFTHNHPSGTVQPSRADEALTQTLKMALALVDVRVLDHVIVSGAHSLSMAEKGLL